MTHYLVTSILLLNVTFLNTGFKACSADDRKKKTTFFRNTEFVFISLLLFCVGNPFCLVNLYHEVTRSITNPGWNASPSQVSLGRKGDINTIVSYGSYILKVPFMSVKGFMRSVWWRQALQSIANRWKIKSDDTCLTLIK